MSIEDNSKLTKLLNKGLKRPIFWNEYKVTPNKVVESAAVNDVTYNIYTAEIHCQLAIAYVYLFFYFELRHKTVSIFVIIFAEISLIKHRISTNTNQQ